MMKILSKSEFIPLPDKVWGPEYLSFVEVKAVKEAEAVVKKAAAAEEMEMVWVRGWEGTKMADERRAEEEGEKEAKDEGGGGEEEEEEEEGEAGEIRKNGDEEMRVEVACDEAAAEAAAEAEVEAEAEPDGAAAAFVIRTSATGGLGAFATRTLRPGEVILEEPAALVAADRHAIFSEFERLDAEAQQAVLALHASEHFKQGTPLLEAIWDTNSFATGINREAGLFPVASRFNHACSPSDNVHFGYDAASRRLRMWIAADTDPDDGVSGVSGVSGGGGGGGGGGVAAGKELKICYGAGRSPALLYKWYGFRCACGACGGLSDEEMDELSSVQW